MRQLRSIATGRPVFSGSAFGLSISHSWGNDLYQIWESTLWILYNTSLPLPLPVNLRIYVILSLFSPIVALVLQIS